MDRVYPFTISTPAGTPRANPVITALPLEDAQVSEVRIIIPSGHVGVTGIRLKQSKQQVVPWGNDQYIVGNDREVKWPFAAPIGATGFSCESYNTGQFPHNHYLEIVVTDPPIAGIAAQAGSLSPLVVPSSGSANADPLSPDVLLASVPDLTDATAPVDDLALVVPGD